jgi:hypothetical protein
MLPETSIGVGVGIGGGVAAVVAAVDVGCALRPIRAPLKSRMIIATTPIAAIAAKLRTQHLFLMSIPGVINFEAKDLCNYYRCHCGITQVVRGRSTGYV